MRMDETLYGISEKVKNFAVIYLVDITKVPDFTKVNLLNIIIIYSAMNWKIENEIIDCWPSWSSLLISKIVDVRIVWSMYGHGAWDETKNSHIEVHANPARCSRSSFTGINTLWLI